MVSCSSCYLLALFVLFSFDLVSTQVTLKALQPQPDELQLNYIKNCCASTSNNSKDKTSNLHKCVGESTLQQTAKLLNTSVKSRVGIITFASSDIWSYSVYSSAIHQAYAEHNGYIYRCFDDGSIYDTTDMRWVKVKVVEEAMHPANGWARDLKYLMWIDADALVVDLSLRIEQIFQDFPRAHFIACTDQQTKMNSGIFLVRNSPWARQFLADWWGSRSERDLLSDQVQFDRLYMEREKAGEDMSETVVLLPSSALNAVMFSLQPQNQIIHLMGENNRFRAQVFSHALNHICQHVSSPSEHPLSPQLGLSRKQLLEWAVDYYAQRVKVSLPQFIADCDSGDMDVDSVRAIKRDVTRLGISYSSYFSSITSNDEAVLMTQKLTRADVGALHTRVFAACIRYIEYLRSRRDAASSQQRTDIPELLKITAELGMQIFEYVSSESDFESLANQLEALLQSLVKLVLPDHLPGVYQMLSDLAFKRGVFKHQHRDHKSSLKYFELQLKYSKLVAKRQGKQNLITPLFQVASMNAVVGRHKQANKLFLQALKLSDKHLGHNSASLPQYLLNFALSKLDSGSPAEAILLIKRGFSILDLHVSSETAFDRDLRAKFDSQMVRARLALETDNMSEDEL